MTWFFLCASALGLGLTLNAFFPARRSQLLFVPSFFAGWLVSEAPLHHFAAQFLIGAYCLAHGALARGTGMLACALWLVSLAGLVVHHRLGHAAREVFERALAGTLGDDYRQGIDEARVLDADLPFGRSFVPVWLTDGRVRRVKHIAYADGGKRRTLDVYTPRAGVSRAPVLVQIHGGGWTIGHKEQQGRPLVHYMAASGWVVVTINYRLSPRARWPEHLIDVKLALAWVKANIADYGGDPDFIVCTGGSAGGHLTAMIALTPNDPRFQTDDRIDTSVRAAIPLYAPYDFCDREGKQVNGALARLLERYVVGQKLCDARALFESGSPLAHVHEDAPPFFVIHGAADSLACVEEARLFVARLSARSRSPVVYAELPHTQHAFEVFHSPRALHTIRAIHRFAEHVYAQYLREKTPRATSYIRELAPHAERAVI